MSTLASDNFNRADESPIASPWAKPSALNGLRIVSNQVANVTANSDSAAYHAGVSWPNDQYSQVTIATIGDKDGGPAVRMSADDDCYVVTSFGTQIHLFLVNGGSFSELAFVTGAYAPGDVVRLEAQGTTLRVKVNGVTVITHTDATLSGGSAGIFIFDGDIRVDDWEGGDFSSGPVKRNNLALLGCGR